ncbi:MAG: hypothetical protein RR806_07225 [Oscillospiraceae bacterium]
MKAFDTINKIELEVDDKELIRLMVEENRQVDFILAEEQTDSDGYLTWDVEHWCTVDGKRFIRTYALKGRELRDSTTHNIYDIRTDFTPEKAAKVQLS